MLRGSMFTASLLLMGATSPAMSTEVATGSCPVTLRQGDAYGNDALQTFLPPDGKLVFQPGGAGFVDHDGALGIKYGWERLVTGALSVGGRRLDGKAGPARAYISDGYGDTGFQPIYLVFPTPGCWEITGRVGEAKLTFVVFVEKIGEGPSGRFDGVPSGWRQTT